MEKRKRKTTKEMLDTIENDTRAVGVCIGDVGNREVYNKGG